MLFLSSYIPVETVTLPSSLLEKTITSLNKMILTSMLGVVVVLMCTGFTVFSKGFTAVFFFCSC